MLMIEPYSVDGPNPSAIHFGEVDMWFKGCAHLSLCCLAFCDIETGDL